MSVTELLRDLVCIPSVNPMGRSWVRTDHLFEFRLTDYLEAKLREWGIPTRREDVLPQRSNLVASCPAPEATRSILFEVHQDTVPVEGMTIPPFGGEVRDGKLYGRGACDVKGSMAAMLSVLHRLSIEKPRRRANLSVAFTVDEEHTFLGVQKFAEAKPRADFAIVAEPTRLNIVDAHKGVVRWKVTAVGRSCHSSRPDQGVNAIYRMGNLLQSIEAYAQHLLETRSDPRLGPATISVGRIEGGVSVNTVPDFCTIEIDRRLIPSESPQEAYHDFERYLQRRSDIPFTMEPIWLACPALKSVNNKEVIERLGAAINSLRGRHEVFAVPFGTDASTLAEIGIPTVVFGPGDIAQAHTCDEWVEISEVEAASEILYRLVVQE
jgi:acetylornithine deacetylase